MPKGRSRLRSRVAPVVSVVAVASFELGFRVAPVRPEPAKSVKLSYKDQRRLQELEATLAKIPGDIAKLEAELAYSALYSRDFPKFERLMKTLEAARTELSASENEWLALEERREALEAGR